MYLYATICIGASYVCMPELYNCYETNENKYLFVKLLRLGLINFITNET